MLKAETISSSNGPPRKIAKRAETVQDQTGKVGAWKYDENAIRLALAEMIIVDEKPFKLIETQEFRDFFALACPRFHLPSKETLIRDCYGLYQRERNKLKSFIKQSYQSVCLTIDSWTSLQRMDYMRLTCCFIDRNWQMHRKVLNFCPIDSYRGDSIGKNVETCLLEWGIDRVFTVMFDNNATSNDVGISYLKRRVSRWGGCPLNGKWMHMRCFTHVINLVVLEALRGVNNSVERIREAVKFVRHSSARLRRFKECVQREKIASRKMLFLDVSSRWKSTYLMLDSAIVFERAFERFGDCDPHFIRDLPGEKSPGIPTALDWENAKKLVKVLEYFYDLTCRVFGPHCVTSDEIFHALTDIECLLNEWVNDADVDLSLMGLRMKEKYDKYWGDLKEMNMLIYVAAILDPRYKFVFVEHCLKKLYPGQVGAEMANLVKDSMYELFRDYCDKHGVQADAHRCSNENSSEISNTWRSRTLAKQFKRQRIECGALDKKSEMDKYLGDGFEEDSDDFDILTWWKENSPRFPVLSCMARDVLAIPMSGVASELAFSTDGQVLDSFRSSLTPKILQAIVCTQDWLGKKSPVTVEETWDEIEFLEEEFSSTTLDSFEV